MQQDRYDRAQTQTRQIPASFKCKLCLRNFSTNHGKNIHLSSCRKRFSSAELNAGVQTVQQDEVQANVNITIRSQSTPTQLKIWGDYTKDEIHQKIDEIYEEIVFWRWNLFKLPSGAGGKKFIAETTKWIEFWNQGAIEFRDIALKVLMVMPALLLQKPTFKSTAKEHSQCLSRRLTHGSWANLVNCFERLVRFKPNCQQISRG